MRVLSVSPLCAGSVVWQPRRGAFALTVVAKATFRLLPGKSVLVEDQEFVNEEDNHWNDDPARSLYAPNDLSPRKARADVILVGHAFAPGGDPVRVLRARLGVGAVDKEIEIFGERALAPDGRLVEGAPFAKMQLRYERAAAHDIDNPVGIRTGPGARPADGGKLVLPNLVPPRAPAPTLDAAVDPVGFGPIAPGWPARRKLLGAHEALVADGGWRKAPLPEDLDLGYFNVAPRDQQLDHPILPDVRIALLNLHPEHARLVTRLPGLRPRAVALRPAGAPTDVAMKADTLWIDTDRAICTLTWRGEIAMESRRDPGRVLIAMEQGTQRLDVEEIEALAPPDEPEPPPSIPTEPLPAAQPPQPSRPSHPSRPSRPNTLPLVGGPTADALPFQARAMGAPSPAETRARAPAAKRAGPDLTRTRNEEDTPAPRDAAPPWLAAAASAAPSRPIDATELLWLDPASVDAIRETWRALLGDAGGEARDDVLRVLGAGQPLDAAGLEDALEAGVGPGGRFRAPLALLRGVLRLPFDADVARQAREALAGANGSQLEADIERHLLRRRCYQRRTVLGEEQIRTLLALTGAEAAVPAYLPVAAAKVLPMLAAMKARVIAEVRPQQDRYEDHPVALRVVALGWEISVGRRGAG
jgi:hypothetical protein